MEIKYTVYMHETPNNKRYIGITCRKVKYRWNNGHGYSQNKHFYNAILKYGWDNIKHIIVAENLSKEDAYEMERMLISQYDATNPSKGYNNSTGGGGGALGVKYSREVIEKRRAHRVYTSSWAKGKHFSEEHRQKIGEAHRGMKHTDEAKEKMRKAHLGFVAPWRGQSRSDEYRAKKSKAVVCVETGTRYFGLMEAERQTGISHSNISNCLKGKREHAGGYHWQYADAI